MKVYGVWQCGWEFSSLIALYTEQADADAHLQRYESKYPHMSKSFHHSVQGHILRSKAPTWPDLTEDGYWKEESVS